MNHYSCPRLSRAWFMAICLFMLGWATPSLAALTITPITWNVIGLDSNSPASGPFRFPVAARVCAVGAPSNGAITATMQFHTGGTDDGTFCTGPAFCINFRAGSLSSIPLTTGPLAAGSCADAYFEVAVAREAAAFTRARRYSISATDGDGSVNTPRPRELYVERLISQNRNSVQNVSYSAPLTLASPFPTPSGSLTSTAAGGSFGLAVGGIYDVRLDASTATQGYEQLETFANFSNAVFRILRVESTYTANTSPFYGMPPATGPATTSFLYANGCNWQLSPVLPNYLGCQATGKTGGTISATYRIQVLTVPTGSSSTLNTLIYDYSGSSFHYNADNGSGGRTIYIEDPNSATISKAFGPTSIAAGGVSSLTFTITNPNRFTTVTNAAFTDTLPTVPGQMSVASLAGVTYTGCGPGVFSPNPPLAGATSLSFSGATIAPQTSCVVRINVTATAQGNYNNVSSFLSINGVATTSQATASLTVGPVTPTGSCIPGQPMATWNFGTGNALVTSSIAPSAFPGVAPSSVATFNALGGAPAPASELNSRESTAPDRDWQGRGWGEANVVMTPTTLSNYQFRLDFAGYRDVSMSFDRLLTNDGWANSGNNAISVFYSYDNGTNWTASLNNVGVTKGNWLGQTAATTGPSSPTSVLFRIMFTGRNQNKPEADAYLDNVVFTGCRIVAQPTLTKAFGTSPIVAGTNTTLTFTINNAANASTALTGVTFTDALPSGVVISTPLVAPTFSAGCAAGLNTSAFTGIAAGATNLTFNGAVAAGGTCTATVTVRGVTPGTKNNVTSAIFSNQTQTNNGPTGFGQAQLVVFGDVLNKVFAPNPIAAGAVSTLTFVVTNPSATNPITSVGFVDTFPAGLVVAGTPNLTRSPASCGTVGVNWNNTAANQVTLSGATVAAGGSCTYTVDVTAATASTYNNVSGAITFQVNGAGPIFTGDNATASLLVNPVTPRIGLQKRIGLSPTGPWGEFVSLPLNGNVYYQFTIENTGDVVLNRPASGWINDPALGGNICNSGPTSLTTPTITDTHIYECVVGPVVANQQTRINTATASGVTGGGTPVTVTSAPNTASYTTKLPNLLVSKARQSPSTGTVLLGQLDLSVPLNLTYRISVTNQTPSQDVSQTLAPIVIEDTLREGITYLSFTAGDPSWSCSLVETSPDLDKVECTYSNVLPSGSTTTVDLNVLVAAGTPDINNTAVGLGGGDPECIETNASITDCKFPYTEATVPVTLSDVGVTVENGVLVVRFGTAAEAGTLGFRVLGARPGERVQSPINDALTVALGSGFEPQQYEVRGLYDGQTQIWIDEVTTSGKSERYGPYAIGTQSGDRELMIPTDWAAISAEQGQFRQAQAAAIFSRGSGADIEAELRVSATGWVRIGHEDLLAQAIDWSGTSARRIVLTRGSDAVPMRYEGPESFGPGSAVYFLGEATADNLYTTTSVYRLSVSSRARSILRPVYAGAGANPPMTAAPETLLHNPNRGYDMTSAHTDPWYAKRIVRVNAPLVGADESFNVPDRSPNSLGERIEVGIWGGTNFPASPDHSVRLLLNGTEIAQRQFDGLSYQLIAVDLPAGLLLDGSNLLRLELVADTGVFADVVYLDSIKVSYLRDLKATDNRLAFVADLPSSTVRPQSSDRVFASDFSTEGVAACSSVDDACKTYKIAGLTSPDVKVLRARSGGVREELAGTRVEPVAGGFELTFSVTQQGGDRYWIEPSAGAVTAAISPASAVTDPLAGVSANYLIISHPSFIAGLAPLVAARQAEGFTVRVINVEDLYSYYNRGTVDPVAIETAVSDAYSRLGTRYVLLVGGDTYDYLNYLGVNSRSFIPTNYRATGPIVRYSPVDSPYADVDLDGVADLAIGRFPVRTQAELSAMISKTLAYAQAPHSGKVLRIADRTGQDGVSYSSLLSTLDGVLGAGTSSTDVWLDNYPAGNLGMQMARADMVARVNSGQSLVTFLGHSAPASWATGSLLTAAQVHGGLFTNSSVPTVAWVLGCYGTYFTSPTYNTVGAALMVQANGGGAAAVLGSSGLTNINSDLAWMGALRSRIGTQRIGDAMRESQEILHLAEPDYTDITVGGVLLGDPALTIAD